MGGDTGSDPGCTSGRALFRALVAIGLDRRRFSIHEMLTDILEVVAVAEGLKPAQLSGHGERADWQVEAFARAAVTAGLRTRRTPPLPPAAGRFELLAGEFPLFAAAARQAAALAAATEAPEVLWIFADDAVSGGIGRLLAGERAAFPEVLGYPACCVAHDARRDLHSLRALLKLYEAQHGIRGEAAVLAAIEAGIEVVGDPVASEDLATVWRTRQVFPWLGFSACPSCLDEPAGSPAAWLDRSMRELAFALDPAFARGLWRAARGEAALAARGDCRALDPRPEEPCPCRSGMGFGSCCAGKPAALPEFR